MTFQVFHDPYGPWRFFFFFNLLIYVFFFSPILVEMTKFDSKFAISLSQTISVSLGVRDNGRLLYFTKTSDAWENAFVGLRVITILQYDPRRGEGHSRL